MILINCVRKSKVAGYNIGNSLLLDSLEVIGIFWSLEFEFLVARVSDMNISSPDCHFIFWTGSNYCFASLVANHCSQICTSNSNV